MPTECEASFHAPRAEYIEDFAAHFDLSRLIKFNTSVLAAKRAPPPIEYGTLAACGDSWLLMRS